MAIIEPPPPPVDPKDLRGTVWESLSRLRAEAERDMARRTVLVDIVPPGRSTLEPGALVDQTVEGDYRVQSLVVDFAPDVDGEVWIDDILRFQTRDRLGLGGQFTLGDTTGRSYFALRRVRVVAQNQHGTNRRDVRAWMVVL